MKPTRTIITYEQSEMRMFYAVFGVRKEVTARITMHESH
jgi:hypothetical protein